MSDYPDVVTLHRTVRSKNKNEILEVLSKVCQEDLTVPDQNGETVLHLIFANENLTEKEIIELLTAFLDRGADVNAEDRREKTALHRAIQRRMRDVVDLLVRRKADIYKCDCDGNSIAHDFVRDEDMPLGCTFSPEIEAEGVNFTEFLMEKGVNFDVRNNSGRSALHLAIEYNLQHILQVLVKHSQDMDFVDRQNKSLLHLYLEKRAARRKDLRTKGAWRCTADIVRTMLDRGVSSWSRDSNRYRTSLQTAIESEDDTRIIEMLVDHRLNDIGNSLARDMFSELLESCAWWGESRTEYFLNILDELIAKGADVNAKDKNGATPAYHAFHGKNARAVDFLNDHGADFGVSNVDGQNLYHALARLGIFNKRTTNACLQALFDFVASKGCCDLNARNSAEETPLHLAARCGSVAIARKLIDKGAEVNCKDVNGNTPLHCAVRHSVTEKLAELLLRSGADANSKDNSGRRPLAYAVDVTDANELVPMLLKCGAYVNAHAATDLPFRKIILHDNFQLAKEMLAYGADVNDEAVADSLLNSSWNAAPSWPEHEYREAQQFLLQHWMRLRAAKLPYSRDYEVHDDPRLHEDCLKEIELLKNTFINGHTSIYSFLHKDFDRRRSHMNSEKLQELVESSKLEQQFPNYSVVILASYRETVLWKSLLEPAKRAWIQLTNIHLPEECIERIFAHLRNGDLVRMIEHDEDV